ncbi:hypothetical protein C0Q70_13113 [Pomacea canaliculata]|uniref:Homeobox domain-containing protein n=1 Tax=Pomacea canaliculata TaxID=400727 RepID=A0A2T7NWC6_POMCA|nr:hypothetical protein C0Q70_13113 [Pomacea canaliculata]
MVSQVWFQNRRAKYRKQEKQLAKSLSPVIPSCNSMMRNILPCNITGLSCLSCTPQHGCQQHAAVPANERFVSGGHGRNGVFTHVQHVRSSCLQHGGHDGDDATSAAVPDGIRLQLGDPRRRLVQQKPDSSPHEQHSPRPAGQPDLAVPDSGVAGGVTPGPGKPLEDAPSSARRLPDRLKWPVGRTFVLCALCEESACRCAGVQVRQVLGCYTHCFSHGGQVTKDCWTANKVRRTDLLDDLPSSSVDDLQGAD